MFKEFKEFAVRGNVMDLAVGVIIGAAFGKIVSSFVNDILTPLLSLVLGKVDFSNLFISLSGGSYATLKEAKDAGAATLNYGMFVQSMFDFVILAFVIFLMVKQMNKLKREPEAPPDVKECPYCISPVPVRASRCPKCTSELKAA